MTSPAPMSARFVRSPRRLPPIAVWGRGPAVLLGATVIAGAAIFGLALSVVSGLLAGFEPLLVIAVGFGPVFAALAIRRFDAAMLVAFAFLAVVNFEPAPVDLLFAALVPVGILFGHMDLGQLASSRAVHAVIWSSSVLILVSLTLSDDPMHGFQYTLVTIYCFVIMYLVKMYVTSERQMRSVVIGYLVGALASVVLVMGDLAGVLPSEVIIEQGRARGLFKDANVFGPFLIPPLLIVVDEIWRPVFLRSVHVAVRVGMAAMLAVSVFLSFSRAAWGNLIAAFGLYLVLNLRALGPKRRRRVAAALVIAAVGLVAFVIAFDLVSFLMYRANVLQSYDSQRFDAQRTGILLGLSNLVGIGPGMMDVNGLFAPHSLYIRSIAELGVVGFSLLLALVAAATRSFRQLARDDRTVFGLSGTVIIASIVGQLLNSFLIDTLHWRHFWLLLGLAWIGQTPNGANTDQTDPENLPFDPRVEQHNV